MLCAITSAARRAMGRAANIEWSDVIYLILPIGHSSTYITASRLGLLGDARFQKLDIFRRAVVGGRPFITHIILGHGYREHLRYISI